MIAPRLAHTHARAPPMRAPRYVTREEAGGEGGPPHTLSGTPTGGMYTFSITAVETSATALTDDEAMYIRKSECTSIHQ